MSSQGSAYDSHTDRLVPGYTQNIASGQNSQRNGGGVYVQPCVHIISIDTHPFGFRITHDCFRRHAQSELLGWMAPILMQHPFPAMRLAVPRYPYLAFVNPYTRNPSDDLQYKQVIVLVVCAAHSTAHSSPHECFRGNVYLVCGGIYVGCSWCLC
jgi:hypothetical protein